MAEMLPTFCAPNPDLQAKALKIWLISAEGGMQAVAEKVPQAVKIAELGRFRGGAGQVVPFTDGVLVGVGAGYDPFALGAASARLPEGLYQLAEPPEGEEGYLSALGWALGAYQFGRYKERAAPPTLMVDGAIDLSRLTREAAAVGLARDMINTPAEEMGPDDIASMALAVAGDHGATVDIIEGEALETGFPLIHAVGRAAAIPPRLIDLRWGPADGVPITIVGKGVCFDSGGLNIKPGGSMALMKKDMGGAANALGLAQMMMAGELNIRLRLLIPAVENAIAGNAFRPGDVFRARNGQTVEISNTDAEGRLILADALAYGAEEPPARMISLATLTGAARVALGPDMPPIYSTDEAFAHEVRAAGDRLADPVWPMPLWRRYEDYLSSDIADVNHASPNSFGGSITAALFLTRFVPKTIPYTHLDIYAWTPKGRPGRPKGGEAQSIRALYDVLAHPLSP